MRAVFAFVATVVFCVSPTFARADPTSVPSAPASKAAPELNATIDARLLPPSASPPPSPSPLRAAPQVDLGLACPNTRGVAKLQESARDAHAIASYDQERSLLKQVALGYFKCASSLAQRKDTNGLYAHDRALFLYASALQSSFPHPPDQAATSQLSEVLNGLANSTTFADVHDDAAVIAKRLPAAPTPIPTAEPVDSRFCRASGFGDTLSAWVSKYNEYAQAVTTTNQMGVQRANLFTEIAYSADIASENKLIQQMRAIEVRMDAATRTMRESRAVDSANAASIVITHVHEVGAYAEGFTGGHHRGAAATSDRDHLQTSRLAVDEAAQKLKQVPYCER